MSHWASTYIGRPWSLGGVGPDTFDCWGFFRFIQSNHYGIDVPLIGVATGSLREIVTTLEFHNERSNWSETSSPSDGDAVLMARSQRPAHIGVWIKANGSEGVLHCMAGPGVVFQSKASLRIAGWGHLAYYRRSV